MHNVKPQLYHNAPISFVYQEVTQTKLPSTNDHRLFVTADSITNITLHTFSWEASRNACIQIVKLWNISDIGLKTTAFQLQLCTQKIKDVGIYLILPYPDNVSLQLHLQTVPKPDIYHNFVRFAVSWCKTNIFV